MKTLTQTQARYLALIQQAREQGISLRCIAEQYGVKPANLYAAAKQLRKIGALETDQALPAASLVSLTLSPQTSALIELDTQLDNGRGLRLRLEPDQLASVIKALSA